MADDEILDTLKNIESNQARQIEMQTQALELQAEQFDLVQKQYERAEKLQDRAEQIQERGASLMGSARKLFIVVVPIVFLLIVYLSWLLFF